MPPEDSGYGLQKLMGRIPEGKRGLLLTLGINSSTHKVMPFISSRGVLITSTHALTLDNCMENVWE